MLRFIFVFLAIIICQTIASAQVAIERPIPYVFNINNYKALQYYRNTDLRYSSDVITSPPEEEVRAMAEWEEQQAVVITWENEVPIQTALVRHLSKEMVVLIICRNENVVRNVLTNSNVPITENVQFIVADFNSIWVRDYGPNAVYLNDVDSLVLVDWIYNRPRPLDDVVSEHVAEALNIPLYATIDDPYKFVGTGGNFMSDGMGQSFSSKLIINENPNQGLNGVDEVLSEFMGVQSYPKFDNLPFDVIHHIDMHMKIIDEQTILVGEYPEGVADGPQIEANIQYLLDNFTNSFGKPYNIVRMPMPPDFDGTYPNQGGDYRTYVNAYIGNKTIVVPTYQERYDTTALRIWKELMPGYTIQGINCNTIIRRLGALHCITKEIGVQAPLRIVHEEPIECLDPIETVQHIEAIIQHKSEIKEAFVHIKNSSGTFDAYALDLVSLENDLWTMSLGKINLEGLEAIEYYFSASANSGKEMTRPIVAPEGLYKAELCQTMTSVDEAIELENTLLNVFPNPANAITCIPLMVNKTSIGALSLVDMLGAEVLKIYEGKIYPGERKFFFDASKIEAGMYVVKYEDGQHSEFQKIFITH